MCINEAFHTMVIFCIPTGMWVYYKKQNVQVSSNLVKGKKVAKNCINILDQLVVTCNNLSKCAIEPLKSPATILPVQTL